MQKFVFSCTQTSHVIFRHQIRFAFLLCLIVYCVYVSHLPHSVEILRLSILDGYSKCIAMCSSWSIASMGGCFQLFPLYLQCVVYCTAYIYILYIFTYLHIYGHVVVFCRPKKGAYSIKRPNIYQTWTPSIRFSDEPRRTAGDEWH